MHAEHSVSHLGCMYVYTCSWCVYSCFWIMSHLFCNVRWIFAAGVGEPSCVWILCACVLIILRRLHIHRQHFSLLLRVTGKWLTYTCTVHVLCDEYRAGNVLREKFHECLQNDNYFIRKFFVSWGNPCLYYKMLFETRNSLPQKLSRYTVLWLPTLMTVFINHNVLWRAYWRVKCRPYIYMQCWSCTLLLVHHHQCF